MSLFVENELITSILEGKIKLDEVKKSSFETRQLKALADVYEWLDVYCQTNNNLPTIELVETRYPLYKRVEVKDNPKEILDALRRNSEIDRFHEDIKQSIKIINDTGDVQKAKIFLDSRLSKYDERQEDYIHELSSPDFIIGEMDYAQRRTAFLGQGRYGIPSGFGKELDEFLMGGWQKGNMYGIVGETGVSKTWCVLVSADAGAKYGKKILCVMPESNITREYYRLLTIATGIDNIGTLSGKLDIDEFLEKQKTFREIYEKSGGKVYLEFIGRRNKYKMDDLKRMVDRIQPDELIVDYITLLSTDKDDSNWSSFLGVSRGIKLLAAGYDIPTLAVLQGTIGSGADEMDLSHVAQSKGMSRDFDEMLGIRKIDGLDNHLGINDIKTRDGNAKFQAIYKTNWNTGKVNFVEYENKSF